MYDPLNLDYVNMKRAELIREIQHEHLVQRVSAARQPSAPALNRMFAQVGGWLVRQGTVLQIRYGSQRPKARTITLRTAR